ncbi:uncharacterized protein LOC132331735 isoform X2 [Haemorhous mexicanus]|uniref:uncharacterized protein LOC132331735 isoform X2 n=1 Tax=Haemorhous mexicanus TaxID=30427 RepID=UPI0028BD59D0|nr:uncharacterized protein LOC132331735 isoform X2 [Haemorhous mexicanus]
MGQDNSKLQPGDLIEIDRPRHQHWALYIGNGYVINLIPAGKQDLKVGVHTLPLFIRKVKKQLLKEVVRNHKWRVNNKYDHSYKPLQKKEIICRAERYDDRKLNYWGFGSNCEHFVTNLRYGDQLSTFVGSELQNLDMTEDKNSPNPGDLIEIKMGGSYEHWALCVGKQHVIHMTPLDEETTTLSASSESVLTRKARVTKELLEAVARNDDWSVNNKCDLFRTPLPVEEIIWRAHGCIGKELTYDVLSRCSEDFVTNLRYGGPLRALLCGEMQNLDMTEDKNYPNPGDLIEIKRSGYQHWALYLRKGYVIHVTDVDEGNTSLSSNSGSVFLRNAIVRKELLKAVAGNYKWRVNNKYDCYRTPFPMKEIIRRAEPWIGKKLPYRLFRKNCEHFVTKLRYGDGVSEQAKTALQNINSVSSVVLGGIGVGSLIAAAGIPVVGLPLMASASLAAAGGGSLLGSIGFTFSNIADSFTSAKFEKAGRDILEKSCC